MIKFILLVNKQGQTRLSRYYEHLPREERTSLEAELVRKCLSRHESQCSFAEYRNYKIVYRRYASLFIIAGIDANENELAVYEFIHNMVEIFDKQFNGVVSDESLVFEMCCEYSSS